jgi:hypothetical protein
MHRHCVIRQKDCFSVALQGHKSRDSDEDMGWTTEKLGFDSQHRKEKFLFSIMSRRALGPTQPSTQWASGAVPRG